MVQQQVNHYRIANQLNAEGIRPVHSDRWYSTLIDGLLENSVMVGKPSWNKTSQSTFRHVEGGKIVSTDDDKKATYRQHAEQEWFKPFDQVFDRSSSRSARQRSSQDAGPP